MKRRDVLRAAALTPLALPWLGRAHAAPPANVVDLYREAIRAMPAWTEADRTILNAVATTPLDRGTESILRRAEPALGLLIKAASATNCDWGDTWTGAGFETSMDFIGGARNLARLALLQARYNVEAGHPDQGLRVAFAAIVLGGHLVQGGVMIAQLVGLVSGYDGIGGAAATLTGLDRASLVEVDRRYRSLPPLPSLAATVRFEKAFFLGYCVPKERAKFDDAEVARLSTWYDRTADACATSEALAALRATAKAKSEEAQFFDALDGYRNARTYAEVKHALFLAAIAAAADGPGALATVPDPTDGLPFDVRSWATGFELTSRFGLENKPRASLVVGRR